MSVRPMGPVVGTNLGVVLSFMDMLGSPEITVKVEVLSELNEARSEVWLFVVLSVDSWFVGEAAADCRADVLAAGQSGKDAVVVSLMEALCCPFTAEVSNDDVACHVGMVCQVSLTHII